MRYENLIAMRYLKARRKQALISIISFISVLGFAVGVCALIIALAMMTGFREDITGRILSTGAHIVVRGAQNISEENAIRIIEETPGVVAVTPVIYDKGVLTGGFFGSDGCAVTVKGVDPEREARVTSIRDCITEGSFFEGAAKDSIVIGADLADELGADIGDKVRLLLPRLNLVPFGAIPRSTAFEVVGIFQTGLYTVDASMAYIPIEKARLLRSDGAQTMFEAKVRNPDKVEYAASALSENFGFVMHWKEMNKPLFSAFKIEKLLMFIAIGLIVVVASFTIVTSLVLMVMEKHRDIGILKAMGAMPGNISKIFVLQGFLVGAIGTFIGVISGVGICFLLDRYRLIALSPEVYFISYVPFHLKFFDVATVILVSLIISVCATIWPAREAARLSVVEALRYE